MPPADSGFYGRALARIHDSSFGALADAAARSVVDALRAAGFHDGTVVELGVGSGLSARVLLDAGYRVTGIDVSEDMLDLARARAPEASFTLGSLVDAALPPDAVAVTAIGEPLNYAAPDLEDLARRVRACLRVGGIFAFDIATPGRAGPEHRRSQFFDEPEWTMHVDIAEDDGILTRAITLFARDGDHYTRIDETHRMQLFEPADVRATLERNGFDVEQRTNYGPADTIAREGWTVFFARAVSRER